MSYLLNVVYLLAVILIAPWLIYQSIRTGKYREGFLEKIFGLVRRCEGNAPCIWLHAVSVGEINALAPLVTELAERRPDCRLVISTTTKTGYALAKSKYAHLTVFYCPLDFSWAVNCAMRRVRPQLFLLAELELWPNLICAARRHGAKVGIINGRLSQRSFRGYVRARPLISWLLRKFNLVAVQNHEYARRFRALGGQRGKTRITGSLKFDGAQTDRDNPATQRLQSLAGFQQNDVVFLAGSTQDPEESLAVETFRTLQNTHRRLRLVIVPRHPERFAEVARMLDASGLPWQRRSELIETIAYQGVGSGGTVGSSSSTPSDETATFPPAPHFLTHPRKQNARILLVDTIGELGAWWGTATIAFVGGSLGRRGGQNMIEPAAYGAAVSFGPNTQNFRDVATAMCQAQAAVVVRNGEDLTDFVRRCLDQPQFATELGRRAKDLVLANLGAAKRTADLIEALLPPAPAVDARVAA